MLIEAGLQNNQLLVNIISKETGEIIFEFRGKEVMQMFTDQVVSINDLIFRNKATKHNFIHSLIKMQRK